MGRRAVAIVGIACRLPGGARDLASFWSILSAGRDVMGDVPADRWSRAWYGGPRARPGRTRTHRGAFLDGATEFDAGFFEIAEDEAAAIDPHHRVLLELAVEALDDAGVPHGRLRGEKVGVFVGLSNVDHAIVQQRDVESVGPHSHNTKHYIGPNRISHFFDWRGPSFSVDAACATSLVAIHQACQSIALGESSAALCGAANLMLTPFTSVGFSQLGTLSPGGLCKPFDEAADGYARADGAVMLLLKPLERALADRDRVYAVVRASGVCHGGQGPLGPWAPRHEQQAALVAQVLSDAEITADELSYVEAHGTGTTVGDREEALGLSHAIARGRKTALPIGSVKRLFGHSEAAAGITGALKAVAMLHHGALAPTPRTTPRRDLPLEEMGLRLVEAVEPIAPSAPGLVAINSFGVGGTYAHVILEGPPAAPPSPARVAQPRLVPFSAKDPDALAARAAQLAEALAARPAHHEAAVDMLSLRATHHPYRAAVVAAGAVEAADALKKAVLPRTPALRSPRVVFLFSGTGGQWWGMGRELLATLPAFRAEMARFDERWRARAGWSLLDELAKPEAETRVGRETIASTVAQVAVQAALAAVWRGWGITPSAVMGHSLGEMAAAYSVEAITLDELVALTEARCAWQEHVDGHGTMAAVGLPEAELRDHIERAGLPIDIAAVNAPAAATIVGPADAVKQLGTALEAAGAFFKQLRVTVPFHSRIIRAHHDALVALTPRVDARAPSVPFVSGALGRTADVPLDGPYWLMGFENAVRFRDAVDHVLTLGGDPIFLEIGPHPVLGANVEECVSARPGARGLVLASLRRKEPEHRQLLGTLAHLFAAGLEPDWKAQGAALGPPVALPAYPWRHKPLLLESEASRADRLRADDHPLTGALRAQAGGGGVLVGEARLSAAMFPILASHQIGGEVLFPAAGYLEMFRAAAAVALASELVELREVSFSAALALAPGELVHLRTIVDTLPGRISIHASRDAGASWTEHARARYRRGATGAPVATPVPPDAEVGDAEARYRDIWALGYEFGPHFQSLRSFERWPGHARGALRAHEDTQTDPVMARVLLLDALLQVGRIAQHRRLSRTRLLPRSIDALRFLGPVETATRADADEGESSFGASRFDGSLRDASGAALVAAEGARAVAIPGGPGPTWEPESWLYTDALVPAPIAAGAAEAAAPQPVVVEIDALEASALGLERFRALCADAIQRVVAADGPARLVFAVRGTGRGLAFTALAALRRVVELEAPRVDVKVVELDDASWSHLAAEVACADRERELVWRDGRRMALRLERLAGANAVTEPAAPGPVAVSFDGRGELVLAPLARPVLGPRELRVEVRAASLNFRDVMKVLRMYPAEAGDLDAVCIGDECAGVVTAVGSAVDDLAVGDAVVVRSAGQCLASELTVPRGYVFAMPAGLDWAQAASTPVVFTTAWYALRTLARLAPGERVLIHSAAGGVGLAAIQIARACGAEIYATAGSDAKRRALRALGLTHVFDSKDPGFADDVMAATGGEGVDVVLNSLLGPQMVRSLGVVRELGRFVELGKRDLFGDTAVGLAPFRRSLSYHTVDLAKLWRLRPEAAGAVFEEVRAAFAAGQLQPLPITLFAADRLRDAFAYLQTGEHIGKVVVDLTGLRDAGLPRGPAAGDRLGALVRADGGYLVTGGFGGIGREVLRWLADAGARHLVVIGRAGEGRPADRAFADELRARGVRVDVREGSVADRAVVAAALAALRGAGIALRGVLHLAGVLDDALLPAITPAQLEAVLAPKVDGALHLHELTQELPLDLFVLFSSATASFGAGGQAVYGMANAFLDWLARERRAAGLPGQAIAWGAFLGAGMMSEAELARREAEGVGAIKPSELVRILDGVVPATSAAHVVVRPIDWERYAADDERPRYAGLRRAKRGSAEGETVAGRFRAAPAEEASALAQAYLVDTVAKIRGVQPERISAADTLSAIGCDSLALINLKNRILYDLGVTLSSAEVGPGTALTTLAASVVRGRKATPVAAVAAVTPVAPSDDGWLPIVPGQGSLVALASPVQPYQNARPILSFFEGAAPLDAGRVRAALAALAARHEALRLGFAKREGRWQQRVRATVEIPLTEGRARDEAELEDVLAPVVSAPWRLDEDALVRAILVRREGKPDLLALALNHLVADQLTLWLLRDELPQVYDAQAPGSAPLPPLTGTTFSHWARTWRDRVTPAQLERARALLAEAAAQPRARDAWGRPARLVRPLPSQHRAFASRELMQLMLRELAHDEHTGLVRFLHHGRVGAGDVDTSRTMGPFFMFALARPPFDDAQLDVPVEEVLATNLAIEGISVETRAALESRLVSINAVTSYATEPRPSLLQPRPLVEAMRYTHALAERAIQQLLAGPPPARTGPDLRVRAELNLWLLGEQNRLSGFVFDPALAPRVDAICAQLTALLQT